MNSSLKLIRPTQHTTPYNFKDFEKTINLFGFNIEPFSLDIFNFNNTNNDKNKEYIPTLKIEMDYGNAKIAQCINCKGIYHKLNSYCQKIKDDTIFQVYSYKCSICKYKSKIEVIEKESKNSNNIYNKQNKEIYFIPKINEINGYVLQ